MAPAQEAASSSLEAIDVYMKMFLRFAALFLQGLTMPRSQQFMSVSCLRDLTSTKPPTVLGATSKVLLTELIVDYLVTQVFPLEQVYESSQIAGTSIRYVEADVMYFNEFASELPFAKCQPKVVDLVTPGGQKSLHRLHSCLISYLSTQTNLLGVTSKENVLNRLSKLSRIHQPNVSGLKALLNSSYPELVKIIVWYASAFADWFQIDFIEPADVLAVANLLVCNVIFPLHVDKFVQSREGFIVDLVNNKEYAKQQSPEKIEEIYDELYQVFEDNDLYISEPALRNVILLIINILNNESLTAKVLQVGMFTVKI